MGKKLLMLLGAFLVIYLLNFSYRTGSYVAVDGYDLDPCLGGSVNGGGVVLVINGGEDQGFRARFHCIGHHLVLGFVVLLGFGTGDGEFQVIFCGGGLCSGKDG